MQAILSDQSLSNFFVSGCVHTVNSVCPRSLSDTIYSVECINMLLVRKSLSLEARTMISIKFLLVISMLIQPEVMRIKDMIT